MFHNVIYCLTQSYARECQGNIDKQGGNILIQTTYGDWKAMGKRKNVRTVEGKGSHIDDSKLKNIEPEDLVKMKDIDIREADREALADILEIEIDKDLSVTEKKREFIRQIKNPYLYRQGEYVVKLSFADTGASLTDRLKEYIEHVAATGL